MQIRVILVEPEHEGNIGSIARAMKNFGFHDLWVVNPKTEIGLQAKAYASHGADTLRKLKTAKTIEEAIEGCNRVVGTTAISGHKSSNVLRTSLSPERYARTTKSTERIGLIFGRESRGLSNKELETCDSLITIPASREYGTLNVAMACTIILYELYKHTRRDQESIELVDSQTRRRLIQHFGKLTESIRTPAHRNRLAVRAFRNLLSRGLISKREALLLTGIIRRAYCLAEKKWGRSPDEPLNTA